LLALGRDTGPRKLSRGALQNAALAGSGVVLATVFGQSSWRVALLILPVFLGAWLGARALLRRAKYSPAARGRAMLVP
jgi:uncharacterized membrane protein YfcA